MDITKKIVVITNNELNSMKWYNIIKHKSTLNQKEVQRQAKFVLYIRMYVHMLCELNVCCMYLRMYCVLYICTYVWSVY